MVRSVVTRSRRLAAGSVLAVVLAIAPTAGSAQGLTAPEPPAPLFDRAVQPVDGADDMAASPLPCSIVLPDIDDRCEEWVGPRVDGPGRGPDGPGGPSVVDPVGVSPDGSTFFSVGIADVDPSAGQDLDMMTVATQANTGATKWTARFAGGFPHLLGVALSVDPQGRYVDVTGRGGSNSYNPCAMTTVAYEMTTGRLAWQASAGDDANDCVNFNALEVDPSGERVDVAAERRTPADLSRWVVLAYDAQDGRRVWSDEYLGTLEAGATASALAFSPDELAALRRRQLTGPVLRHAFADVVDDRGV